jgi:hypothetical protein
MKRNLDNQSKNFFVKILLSEALKLGEFEKFFNDFTYYLKANDSGVQLFLFLMDDIWAQESPISRPINFDVSKELKEPTGTIRFTMDGLYDDLLRNFQVLLLEYSFEDRVFVREILVQAGGGVMDEDNWIEIELG